MGTSLELILKATDNASPAVKNLRGNVHGLASAAGSASGQLGMMGVAIGTMVGNLATSAINKISELTSNVVQTGIRFNNMGQQAQIAFTTMLGSGGEAESFLNRLKDFAAQTPFEFPDLLTASQRMLAMGFQSDKVLPTLTAIGDAVAGLGGSSYLVDRVTTALGQMQAKGKASGEEMMQLTEAGIPAWEMLAKAIGVSVADAMKMVSDGAVSSDVAITALVDGMNAKFGGLMAQQSKTFGGLYSTIKDTFAQVSGQVMGPLFERLTEGFAAIVDWTSRPEFTAGVEKLTAWIDRALSAMISWAQSVLPTVREALARVWSIAVDVWGVLQELWGALKTTWATIKEALAPIADATRSWVTWKDVLVGVGGLLLATLIPAIGVMTAAIFALAKPFLIAIAAAAALRMAWENDFMGIQTAVRAAWEYLSTVFGGLGETIKQFGAGALKEIALWVSGQDTDFHNVRKIWDSAKQAFGRLWEDMKDALKGFMDHAWRQLKESWPKTTKFFTDAVAGMRKLWVEDWGGIRSFLEGALRGIESWLKRYTDIWKGDWGKTMDYLTSGMGIQALRILVTANIPGWFQQLVLEVKWKLQGWYQYWVDYFYDMRDRAKHIWSEIKNDIMHIWNTWLTDIKDKMTYWFGEGGRIDTIWSVWWSYRVRDWKNFVKDVVAIWDEWFAWFKPGDWLQMGKDLLDGLWKGLKYIWDNGEGGGLWGWTKARWEDLKRGFQIAFDQHSPSGWFMDAGHDLFDGLRLGMQSSFGSVVSVMDSLSGVIKSRTTSMTRDVEASMDGLGASIINKSRAIMAETERLKQAANVVATSPAFTSSGNRGGTSVTTAYNPAFSMGYRAPAGPTDFSPVIPGEDNMQAWNPYAGISGAGTGGLNAGAVTNNYITLQASGDPPSDVARITQLMAAVTG